MSADTVVFLCFSASERRASTSSTDAGEEGSSALDGVSSRVDGGEGSSASFGLAGDGTVDTLCSKGEVSRAGARSSADFQTHRGSVFGDLAPVMASSVRTVPVVD